MFDGGIGVLKTDTTNSATAL